jgi:pseudomonalisin
MARARLARAIVAVACAATAFGALPGFAGHVQRVTVAGWTAPPAGARSLGPARGDGTAVVDLVLRTTEEPALAALAQRVLRSGAAPAPVMSPDDYAARFGADQRAVLALRRWAARAGVRISHVGRSRTLVQLAGRQAGIERLLEVRFARWQAGGSVWWQADRPPTVPAGLPVVAVVGLDSRMRASLAPHAARMSSASPGSASPGPTSLGIDVTTPRDLWDIYDQPAGNRGSGERLAIIGEGSAGDVDTALRNFQRANGLPMMPLHVHQVGAGPFTDLAGRGEWMIDTQAASGMAPDAESIELYFGRDLALTSLLVAIDGWVGDPAGPRQASASFSWCEAAPGFSDQGLTATAALDQALDTILRQAVVEGRTLFAATGDTGSSCPLLHLLNGIANDGVPIANYPAASPYAVAVGGTVLYPERSVTRTARGAEFAWTHSGGGSALFVPQPAYQAGVATMPLDCISAPDGTPYAGPTPCRGIPDVAAQSGDVVSNGYLIYDFSGAPLRAGGTSLSAPLWQGMWARVQAAAPVSRGGRVLGLGFANPKLYAAAARAAAFTDIVVGGNGAYVATPGWDYVSGWGSPDVAVLMRFLDHGMTPTHRRPAGRPQPVVPPGVAACYPLWQRDGVIGDGYYFSAQGEDPQLAVFQGDMRLLPGGRILRVSVDVMDMEATMPKGASDLVYVTHWVLIARGQPVGGYFARADVGPAGTAVYSDGAWDPYAVEGVSPYTTLHTNLRGRIRLGLGGGVDVDVPLADIGAPRRGDVLSAPSSEAYGLVGAPPVNQGPVQRPGTGLVAQGSVDASSPTRFDYTVGEVCARTGRPGTSGG